MDPRPILSTNHPQLNPVVASLRRGHSRSPSRSPTRPRLTDDILADLSPATTLEAFTSASGTLKNSIEAASPAERAFAIRAAVASKKIHEWTVELATWPWPHYGSSGFEMGTMTSGHGVGQVSLEQEDHLQHKEVGDDYWGSMPTRDVIEFENRLDDILDDMDDLKVEDIKSQVLSSYSSHDDFQAPNRENNSKDSKHYTKMDDLTAVVTATVLKALPNLSRLTSLIDVWTIRIAIMRQIPQLMLSLEDVESELNDRIGGPRETGQRLAYTSLTSADSLPLSRGEFEAMRDVLQDKVTTVGRQIDQILDTLEGREDTMPESWLDRMEAIETNYSEWASRSEREVSRAELAAILERKRQSRYLVPSAEAFNGDQENAQAQGVSHSIPTSVTNTNQDQSPSPDPRSAHALHQAVESETEERLHQLTVEDDRWRDGVSHFDFGAPDSDGPVSKRIETVSPDEAAPVFFVEQRDSLVSHHSVPQLENASLATSSPSIPPVIADHHSFDESGPLTEILEQKSLHGVANDHEEARLSDAVLQLAEDEEKYVLPLDKTTSDQSQSMVMSSRDSTTTSPSVDQQDPRPQYEGFESETAILKNCVDSTLIPCRSASTAASLADVNSESTAIPAKSDSEAASDNIPLEAVEKVGIFDAYANKDTSWSDISNRALQTRLSDSIDYQRSEESYLEESTARHAIVSDSTLPKADYDLPRDSLPESSDVQTITSETIPSHEMTKSQSLVEHSTNGSESSIKAAIRSISTRDIHERSAPESFSAIDISPINKVNAICIRATEKDALVPIPTDPMAADFERIGTSDNSDSSWATPRTQTILSLTSPQIRELASGQSKLEESVVSSESNVSYPEHTIAEFASLSLSPDEDKFSAPSDTSITSTATSSWKSIPRPEHYSAVSEQLPNSDGQIAEKTLKNLETVQFIVADKPATAMQLEVPTENTFEHLASKQPTSEQFLMHNYSEPHLIPILAEPEFYVTDRPSTHGADMANTGAELPDLRTPKGVRRKASGILRHIPEDTDESSPGSDERSPPMNSNPMYFDDINSSPPVSPSFFTNTPLRPPPARSHEAELGEESSSTVPMAVPQLKTTVTTPRSLIRTSRSNEHLQQQISSILKTVPARIRLSPGSEMPAPQSQLNVKKTRTLSSSSSNSSLRTYSRAPTPSFTLAPAPAYGKTHRARSQNSNPEIKLYHLSRSTGEAPIKLFVRLVGEDGERVMVRVGGGWSDLGEYLREYASHHGRRPDADGKIEIQDLPARAASSGSAMTSVVFRSSPGHSSPASRPSSAMGRSLPTLAVRKTRKSVGEESRDRSYRSASHNEGLAGSVIQPGQKAPDGLPSLHPAIPTASRSSSRLSFGPDRPTSRHEGELGLAGPKGRIHEVSAESEKWIESMKEKVRQASAEKDREKEKQRRKERFGQTGKVAGTRKLLFDQGEGNV